MFTGVIETVGEVVVFNRKHDVVQLGVTQDTIAQKANIGDSIAINGVCLTVVRRESATLYFDVSSQTLKDTTFDSLRASVRVNMEPAMRTDDRFGGHFVTGHIDGVGLIRSKEQKGGGFVISIEAPDDIMRYIIKKGSIAVDGISLTVADVYTSEQSRSGGGFKVVIIPHTSKITTLDLKKPGDRVNIEADVIGKYVERFVLNYMGVKGDDSRAASNTAVTRSSLLTKLKEEGFITT
ncbi:MAG: riboflavin synthase [Nitrospirae bacterium]|nr:riboflavin synthase [Nitrospirota bacterium]